MSVGCCRIGALFNNKKKLVSLGKTCFLGASHGFVSLSLETKGFTSERGLRVGFAWASLGFHNTRVSYTLFSLAVFLRPVPLTCVVS